MKNKQLLNSISAIALALTTTACLGGEASVSDNRSVQDFTTTTARNYATGISQYAVQSAHLLTNDISWDTQSYTQGEVIDFAALGGSDHQMDDVLASGVCTFSPTKALHITWFDSADDTNDFAIKGLGKDSSASIIISELVQQVNPSNIALFENNDLRIVETGAIVKMPSACGNYDIPSGSPVILTEITIPSLPEGTSEVTEYRTLSCPTGMDGHIVERSTLTTLPTGESSRTAWTEYDNSCRSPIQLSGWDAISVAMNEMNLGALTTASGGVSTIIDAGINDGSCRIAKVDQDSDTSDGGNSKQPAYGGDGAAAMQRPPGSQGSQAPQEKFDTCGNGPQLQGLGSVGVGREVDRKNETSMSECGGVAGTYQDSYNGYVGTASHPIWSGNVEYERDIITYETIDESTGEVLDTREFIDSWAGLHISCRRPEELHISCGTVYPEYNNMYDLTNSSGFDYERINTINGWENAETLTPNPAANPSWNYINSSGGCTWQETETWTCNEGDSMVRGGERERNHNTNSLGAIPTVGEWSLVQSAQCQETRTSTESCTGGQSGTMTVTEQRIYTSNAPGDGSWGNWSESSTDTSGCYTSGGGGGGGGGGTGIDVDNDGVADFSSSYGATHFSQESINGYHSWGVPLVEYMRRHKGGLVEKAVYKLIVEGWIEEMAHRYNPKYHATGSIRGKIVLGTIKPMCTLIGQFVGASNYKKLWKGIKLPDWA